MEQVVAAHQPNFLPWLGFFDKLVRADVLVLLDDVQFPRSSAGVWTNRVRLLVGGRPAWATVPIVRAGAGTQQVREVVIDESQPWRERLLSTIRHSYRRADAFDGAFELVRELVETRADRLAEYNELNLRHLADELGLDAGKLVHSSTLAAGGTGTERLIALTRAAGGTVYLSGDGSEDYLEAWRFGGDAPQLRYQEFRHPTYPQLSQEPVHGLSIVDALLHCGLEGTRRLLSSGRG
ncbi:MAG: WbqC family protein [Gaiellaceae bacterium]